MRELLTTIKGMFRCIVIWDKLCIEIRLLIISGRLNWYHGLWGFFYLMQVLIIFIHHTTNLIAYWNVHILIILDFKVFSFMSKTILMIDCLLCKVIVVLRLSGSKIVIEFSNLLKLLQISTMLFSLLHIRVLFLNS